MYRKQSLAVLIALLCLLFYSAGAQAQNQARAALKDADGKSVGNATLRETKDGVLIAVQVKGLPPGLHAVHVHAVGKCEGPKFTSAGGHFNPMNKKHGLKSADGPHAGDLPDIYVTKDGMGSYEALTDAITLKPGDMAILDSDGSALVVHAQADDNTTDPAGNAGDRIACGVITKSTGKK